MGQIAKGIRDAALTLDDGNQRAASDLESWAVQVEEVERGLAFALKTIMLAGPNGPKAALAIARMMPTVLLASEDYALTKKGSK